MIKIYHNPKCGTSRNVLEMIRATGEEPEIIEYLKTPPTREEIRALSVATGLPLRELLRERGTPFHELGLDDPDVTDEQILDAMEAHPILLNRPIVVNGELAVLARPKEKVLNILPPNLTETGEA